MTQHETQIISVDLENEKLQKEVAQLAELEQLRTVLREIEWDFRRADAGPFPYGDQYVARITPEAYETLQSLLEKNDG